jgi:uncharacterized protein (TIGR03086 family)
MDENTFARFDRAAAAAERLVAGVRPDQWHASTPCTEWTVRQLVNHIVAGNALFTSIVTGAPPPDRSQDHLGDDPVAAFRDSVRAVRTALADDDVLAETYTMPFGPSPGAGLVEMRVNEFVVHGWDLARATGQPAAFDDDLAEGCLALMRSMPMIPRGEGRPFQAERKAPAGSSAVDRLAAYLGRPT